MRRGLRPSRIEMEYTHTQSSSTLQQRAASLSRPFTTSSFQPHPIRNPSLVQSSSYRGFGDATWTSGSIRRDPSHTASLMPPGRLTSSWYPSQPLTPRQLPATSTSRVSTASHQTAYSSPFRPVSRTNSPAVPVYRSPTPTTSPDRYSYVSTSASYVPSRYAPPPPIPTPSQLRAPSPSPAKHPLPCPLPNLGNTCYLNSILQCLIAHRVFISRLQDEVSTRSRSDAPMSYALCDLFRTASGPSSSSRIDDTLYSIKKILAKRNREFAGFEQADAHEALRTLLQIVHDELNHGNPRAPYEELKDIAGEQPLQTMERWRRYQRERDNSVVYDVFGGVHAAVIECDACRGCSYAFDPFLDLSISLPNSGPAHIDDLIQKSQDEERIDAKQQWRCSKCKKTSSAVRWQQTFEESVSPVWHFKRFNSRGDKNIVQVLYSLRRHTRNKSLRLIGVVCHIGTMTSGHYTSYVRGSNDRWYRCNDSIITEAQPLDVVNNPNAYLLFFTTEPMRS